MNIFKTEDSLKPRNNLTTTNCGIKVKDSLSPKTQLAIKIEDSLSLRNWLRHPPNVDQGAK